MKKLIFVCGANGVGKSTACRQLTKELSNSAFIDSEWCRYMNPFAFTDENVKIVSSNISSMMVNYFCCSTIDYVIFSYGLHGRRKEIFFDVINKLLEQNIIYQFVPIIFTCDLHENIRRMKSDSRDGERIKRAIERTRGIYDEYDYFQINVTDLSIDETVNHMIQYAREV